MKGLGRGRMKYRVRVNIAELVEGLMVRKVWKGQAGE